MGKARAGLGIASVVSLLFALNLMVLNDSVFTTSVLFGLIGFAVLGAVWFVLYLLGSVRAQGQSTPFAFNSVVASVAVLVCAITVYSFIKRADISYDLTQEGRRELAPQTIQMLESLTDPVEAYCIFVKAADERSALAQDKTLRFLERCQKYTDLLTIEVLDSQRDLVQMEALNVLRNPIQNVGTVVLQSQSRKKEIPLTQVTSRLEEREFTNALINVSRNQIPKVYFLDGHGGRDIDDQDPANGGHLFKAILQHEAYAVEKFTLNSKDASVPSDCSVLVVNDFSNDLRDFEITALDRYLSDGGRIFFLINPSTVASTDLVAQERLRPWLLSRLGIDVQSDIIMSEITGGADLVFLTDYTQLAAYPDNAPNAVEFRGSYHKTHPITRGIGVKMDLQFVRSVVPVEPLPDRVVGGSILRTTPDTWGETDFERIEKEKVWKRDGYEASGPNSFGVAMTFRSDKSTLEGQRSADGRVVVLGNSQCASNQNLGNVGNADLILNTIAWLTESEDLIAIRPRGTETAVLNFSLDEQRTIVWISVLGTLQTVILIGMGTFLYRRRYR